MRIVKWAVLGLVIGLLILQSLQTVWLRDIMSEQRAVLRLREERQKTEAEPRGIGSELTLEKLFDSGWQAFNNANEMPFIAAYNNKLYVIASYSGMWEFDGKDWKQLFPLGYEHIEAFARTIFKEKLYIGFHEFDSGKDKGFIVRFDGNSFEKVLEGPWLPAELTQYEGVLFAAMSGPNSIWRSDENGDNWIKEWDTTIFTDILADVGGILYAFEGSEGHPDWRVYKRDNATRRWSVIKKVTNLIGLSARGFAGDEDQMKLTFKGELFIGGFSGRVFTWDGTKLRVIWEIPRSTWQIGEESREESRDAAWAPFAKPKFSEGLMFITYEAGTSSWSAGGELWEWDGARMRRLLRLPYRITGVELFQGRLFLTARTTGLAFKGVRRDLAFRNHNMGFVFSAPYDLLSRNAEYPPLVRYIWVDKKAERNTTSTSDDDEGVIIPTLGYRHKTIYVKDSQAAQLIVEVDIDGLGRWETFEQIPLAPDTVRRIYTNEGFVFLRLRVLQGDTNGVLNARVVLEP